MDHFGLVRALDHLYESVVTDPGQWDGAAFGDWMNDLFGGMGPPDKRVAREVRRAVRAAQKLQRFWSTDDPTRPDDAGDWRTRVDMGVGIGAWRPVLEIARAGLDAQPSEELFEEVKRRFREVHSERWMEGTSYEEWRADL